MKRIFLLFLFLLIINSNLYTQSNRTIFVTRLLTEKSPNGYFLEGVKINPFSPVTYTFFGIADTCFLEIEIKNKNSKKIIDNKRFYRFIPGYYKIEWETKNTIENELEEGIYILKIIAKYEDLKMNIESSFEASTTILFYMKKHE